VKYPDELCQSPVGATALEFARKTAEGISFESSELTSLRQSPYTFEIESTGSVEATLTTVKLEGGD